MEAQKLSWSLDTFDEAENHRYMAQLYIHIVTRPKHSIWKETNISSKIPDWSASFKLVMANDYPGTVPAFEMWETNRMVSDAAVENFDKKNRLLMYYIMDGLAKRFTSYLARYGLSHCRRVAERLPMHDVFWHNILDWDVLERTDEFSLSLSLAVIQLRDDERLEDAAHRKSTWLNPRNYIVWSPCPIQLAILDLPKDSDYNHLELADLRSNLNSSSADWIPEKKIFIPLLQLREQTHMEYMVNLAIKAGSASTLRFLLLWISTIQDKWIVFKILYNMRLSIGFLLAAGHLEFAILLLEQEAILRSTGHLSQVRVPSECHDLASFEQWMISMRCHRNWIPCIFATIINRDEESVYKLLKTCLPQNLDYQDKYGLSALHIAVHKGSHKVIRCLLDAGAKADIQDIEGKTPAYHAMILGRKKCLEQLEKSHASVNFDTTDMYASVARKSFQLVADEGNPLFPTRIGYWSINPLGYIPLEPSPEAR